MEKEKGAKRFRRVITKNIFLLFFSNSDNLINTLYCINTRGIIASRLYTKDGSYQLIITAEGNPFIKQTQIHNFCKITQDKILISKVLEHHNLICEENALKKLISAFKVP